jgi:hypothetical protein
LAICQGQFIGLDLKILIQDFQGLSFQSVRHRQPGDISLGMGLVTMPLPIALPTIATFPPRWSSQQQ